MMVLDLNESICIVRDKDELTGRMRSSSRLPQYLITAMFTGAIAVTTTSLISPIPPQKKMEKFRLHKRSMMATGQERRLVLQRIFRLKGGGVEGVVFHKGIGNWMNDE
eukprot:TRINITY_DN3061_c1_g1_i5.p1 TRINITY_DN3061_c1_g1~~TRINITY_DN3061_c1_g1_i5.p1  ORF type:complete len:108 (+),score=17.34 TRINITY_DN3061_c1_g1_i5:205-528(+)